jgi:predicted ATPase
MRPLRFVITGGPAVGKAEVMARLRERGYRCSTHEIGREIYRQFKERLGRHLQKEDRAEYALAVLKAYIVEYEAHKEGLHFYDRGIPDGYGWERFFGVEPSPELIAATAKYRYDGVFVLAPLDTFEDEGDIAWASEREAARLHQLIIQGYVDAGYRPIFVPMDFVDRRVRFIEANL